MIAITMFVTSWEVVIRILSLLIRYPEVTASAVTALGSMLILWQVYESRIQFQKSFSDDMNTEYRELVQEIPVGLLLEIEEYEPEMTVEGGEGSEASDLNLLYNYFDLSNQQVWLRHDGRVNVETWRNWVGGMQTHFENEYFENAWKKVKSETPDNHFEGVEKLYEEDFDDSWDPKTDWNP